MNILMILTSHDRLGDTGKPTGFWLEEFAAPYYRLRDAGHAITLASPKGGQPPLDPKSDAPDAQTDATRRFKEDREAQASLAATTPLGTIDGTRFDGIFFPGGHGPMWDLANDPVVARLIGDSLAAGKPVAAVCHGPAVFNTADVLRGKRVTGFTNEEEAGVGLTDVVPFLLEDMLKAKGAHYEKGPAFKPFVVTDGLIITGQNPASSEPAADALLAALA
jgi:putative intracellular protease/amidase